MTALSNLGSYLKTYRQLKHHTNPALNDKLLEVQSWQRNRMYGTHAKLFSQPQNKLITDYFLNNLYAGDALANIVPELERLVPKLQKLERFAPTTALETGVLGIQCAITATQLDVDVAEWLLDNSLPTNKDSMFKAYRAINAENERRQQIQDLKIVCSRTDKYLNSFILRKAFKMAKSKAYKHNFKALYDFIDAGFTAMKPLKSVTHFVGPFCEKELSIIEDVHNK